MPSDSRPRSFALFSTTPPGSVAPGSTTATVAPASKLRAPQTIWRGSASPTSTRQSDSGRRRMLLPRQHPAHPVQLEAGRDTDPVQRLQLGAGHAQQLAQLGDRHVEADVLPQPRDRHSSELLHEPQVVLPEHADVGDGMAERRRSARRPSPTRSRSAPRRRSPRRGRTGSGRPSRRPGSRPSPPPADAARRPSRAQLKQRTSTSTEGSVNGKKCGRSRTSRSLPNTSRANASSVPLRCARLSPRSTARPSIWVNIAVCVASGVSRR